MTNRAILLWEVPIIRKPLPQPLSSSSRGVIFPLLDEEKGILLPPSLALQGGWGGLGQNNQRSTELTQLQLDPLAGTDQGALGVQPPTGKTENPLLRSGIALAGFNPRSSGTEDGVLTALETAGLNLSGTRLVLLSACETGLGDVANGEGVFGLRRALAIAGAESQVISLWKVADDGTKDLMVSYYKRLIANVGRSESLRQTQLEMLQNPTYQHPFFWSAFIPSGDWTAMGSAFGN